jgi:hypothetical protein
VVQVGISLANVILEPWQINKSLEVQITSPQPGFWSRISMEHVHKLARQAYSQAPWRSQTQWMGFFLLVVVVAALLAFMYLNTTAQAATYGRQIQDMQVNIYYPQTSIADQALEEMTVPQEGGQAETKSIEELRIEIADLEAKLAVLTSLAVIDAKAAEMDMQPTDPAEGLYLVVDGYDDPQQVNLAPSTRVERAIVSVLPMVYKQSLIDWLKQQVVQTTHMFMEEVSP